MTGGRYVNDFAETDEERIKSLTDRERAVVGLIAEGLTNKEIGIRLSIAVTTVTHHLSAIFQKLEVEGRLKLVIFAFTHSLVETPQNAEDSG